MTSHTAPRFDYPRHTIDIDGLPLAYWDEGGGPRALVLLHGISAAAEMWAWCLPTWTARYRVVALDLPGHGQSGIPTVAEAEAFTLDWAGALLNKFCAALGLNGPGLDGPLLVGHSLGTGVALAAALAAPETYAGAALIAPMGFGREVDPVTRLASLPLLGEVLLDPNWLLTRLSLTAPLPVVGAETLAHYKHIYTNRPGAKAYHLALVRQGVGLGGQRISFTATQLAALRRPALVICGGADALFPPLHGQRAAALLRAALHVRPGVGHNLPMEDSEAVARLVLEFAAKAFGG